MSYLILIVFRYEVYNKPQKPLNLKLSYVLIFSMFSSEILFHHDLFFHVMKLTMICNVMLLDLFGWKMKMFDTLPCNRYLYLSYLI